MKQISSTLKGSAFSKIAFYLFCLAALCIQSCETIKSDIKGSIDANHQRFSGASYVRPSTDDFDPGMNLGISLSVGTSYDEFNSGSFNNKTRYSPSDKVYASTDKGPASFFDPNYGMVNTQTPDFMKHVLFSGGIEYVLKRSSDGGSTTSLNYLQIPVYALYYYKLQGAGSVFGGLGPYLAYGFAGSVSAGNQSISAFSDNNGFKRFDAGLGLTVGYKMPQSFSFSLGYDIGLANIQKNAFGDKAQNRGISLNVGYPLDKLINKAKGK
jgi:Outer membrane protein beta-barrel domain